MTVVRAGVQIEHAASVACSLKCAVVRLVEISGKGNFSVSLLLAGVVFVVLIFQHGFVECCLVIFVVGYCFVVDILLQERIK